MGWRLSGKVIPNYMVCSKMARFHLVWKALFPSLALLFGGVLSQDGPIIETTNGPVHGSTFLVNPYNVEVNAFHAIPFGQAPLGDLRFAAPQEPTPWEEVRDATKLGPACMQGGGGIFLLTHPSWDSFSEDCLHLDVYAPTDSSNGPFPVMVWFYGGAYQSGANIQYPGHYLAAKDAVVVVPNYRVNKFGFMYTADSAAPGNAGLLDQTLALQWVQANIGNFGGNPELVTIFGQSAGAGSTGLHLMSPMSTGLFSGAILESGSELAIWAVNLPASQPENYAVQVAEQLDCPTDDTTAMIECLRQVEPEDLYSTRFNCTEGFFCLGMVPVVDGPDGFLPDAPYTLINNGEYNEVPEIIMHTAQDGMIYAFAFVTNLPWNITDGFTRDEFEEMMAYAVEYFLPSVANETDPEDLEQALLFMYSPWPYIEDVELNRDQIGYLVTDVGFGMTADAQAKAHSFTNDVYHMVFEYLSDGQRIVIPDWTGVFHAMEIPYVFGLPYMELNPDIRNDSGIYFDAIRYNDFDREYFDFIGDMWVNFARTRNPTPTPVQPPSDWPPVTWDTLSMDAANYLWVDNDVAELRKDYRQTEYAFWTEYLRCGILGDVFHVPGFTACESAIPDPGSTPAMKASRTRPRKQSLPVPTLTDAMEKMAEHVYSELGNDME